ncbi:MAG TPA: hypothetical protein VL400_08300 [Polyangiaceae bacterium]|jgi:hypothetical protein|nr:hypothetical protein [Polyangiaceae bacterium]
MAPSSDSEEDIEVAHLLELYEGDAVKIMGRIEAQLSILASRAQTLLSLAGITITVTGFSGANIAKTGKLASTSIVLGLVLVLVSAAVTMNGILRVEWTTRLGRGTLEQSIRRAIAVRDQKTRAYSLALKVLIVGLALYVTSVGLLLTSALSG